MDNSNAEFPPVEKSGSPEISLPDIDSKLAELKFFETDLQNEEVDKAKQALRTVFAPKFEWFDSRNIVIVYHGSLQYNDPHNLDADMDFIGENITAGDLVGLLGDLSDQLKDLLPRKKCGIDSCPITVADIKEDLKSLEREEQHRLDGEGKPDFFPDDNAASVLSSEVLFESQRPKLEVKKDEVRKLIANNPRLRKGVIEALGEVIETRKKRREEISPKPR